MFAPRSCLLRATCGHGNTCARKTEASNDFASNVNALVRISAPHKCVNIVCRTRGNLLGLCIPCSTVRKAVPQLSISSIADEIERQWCYLIACPEKRLCVKDAGRQCKAVAKYRHPFGTLTSMSASKNSVRSISKLTLLE